MGGVKERPRAIAARAGVGPEGAVCFCKSPFTSLPTPGWRSSNTQRSGQLHPAMSSARKLRTLPAELLRCPPRSAAGWVCAAPVQGWPPLELPSSLHWPPPVRLPQTLHATSPCHGGAVPQPRRAPLEKSPPDRIHPDADLALLSKPQGVASSKADCEYRQDPERTLCRGPLGHLQPSPGPEGWGLTCQPSQCMRLCQGAQGDGLLRHGHAGLGRHGPCSPATAVSLPQVPPPGRPPVPSSTANVRACLTGSVDPSQALRVTTAVHMFKYTITHVCAAFFFFF